MSIYVVFFGGFQASKTDMDLWLANARKQRDDVVFDAFPYPDAGPDDDDAVNGFKQFDAVIKKIKDTGTITLGYRESSLPFSYLNRRQQPIGYSIDLCREIVEDVSTELDGMEIKITFAP